MAKVSDILKNAHDPRGGTYLGVPHETAMTICQRVRGVLALDINEEDLSRHIFEFNAELNRLYHSDELIAAWSFLNAPERRAWKQYCAQGRKPRVDQ